MYTSIQDFLTDWAMESANTARMMEAMDDSVLQGAGPNHARTLAGVAWHIAVTIPEMMGRTGLRFAQLDEHAPVPEKASAIADAYRAAAAELAERLQAEWTDETLNFEDDMYGEQWTRRQTLQALVRHEIHHRGQMSILMRQAGLRVPGIYGPAYEDWAQFGAAPPAV